MKPETRIITDYWKGYIDLKDNNYIHDKINHKKNFKIKGTDIHTNTIEGIWNGLKMNILPRYRTRRYLYEHLLETQWRMKFKNNNLWFEYFNKIKFSNKVLERYNTIKLESILNNKNIYFMKHVEIKNETNK